MDRLEQFRQHRPLLFSIAYRMLSSVTDAEDMVQEAFIRWQQASEETVQSAKAYLSSIVTRLCIDHLRSARVRREQYVGPWLPEPILSEKMPDPAQMVELADTLSTAFLVLLESLSPTERAVFLLREVFDYDYAEIEQIVGKSAANCRQIVRRAKQNLLQKRPRFDVLPQRKEQLVEQFLQACQIGNLQGLIALLTEDITLVPDRGGHLPALKQALSGAFKVAKFLIVIQKRKSVRIDRKISVINGQPGILVYVNEQLYSVMTFDFEDDRICSVFLLANPDKLKPLKDRFPGSPLGGVAL